MRLPPTLLRAAAGLRPAVPPRLVSSTVAVASLVTCAPVTVVPAVRRALVVAPHPDDETIGCGGTVAQLARQGAVVDVVVCTDGEGTIGSPYGPERTARRRRAEALAACRRLGTADPVFLGLPDGGLATRTDVLAAALDGVLSALRPEVLFVPWALERHPDHRAVVAALAAASPRRTEVWGYEAHTPLHPTHVVALDDEDVARKRAALEAHRTAALAFRLETTLALNRWRSLVTSAGEGHAEAFHVVAWDQLPALAQLGAQAWDAGAAPVPR